MSEKLESRRSFEYWREDDTVGKYYLGIPSSEQIRKADWHYSKMYNRALVEGVATSAEMEDILQKRGILGLEHERRRTEIELSLAAKTLELKAAGNDFDKEKLANEVAKLRDSLLQWNQRISGPMGHTCEGIADNAKTEYLTYAMAQKEDGTLVWPTYDDFIHEENQNLTIRAKYQVLLWLNGLASDFLDNIPESVALRELEEASRSRQGSQEVKQLSSSESAELLPEEEIVEESVSKKRRMVKKV